ncbi:MAG: hypothetical protein ACLTCI_11885 [[Clostridium] nexile]
MYDYESMEIMLQVVNKEDETDVAKKAFQVAVPKKTRSIPIYSRRYKNKMWSQKYSEYSGMVRL